MTLTNKHMRLQEWFRSNSPVALAFSGGVDSSLLLAVGREVLGAKLMPITVRSAFYPAREAREAEELSKKLDIHILWLEADPLGEPAIAANPENRCYLCKLAVFNHIIAEARSLGIKTIIDGTNVDDLNDYRPGAKALKELAVRSPLMELGFTKAEIRELSKQYGLEGWDKPAYACLASRIPYGETITPKKLAAVEAAEDALFELGFRQLRVRHHGTVARIEVPVEDMARFCDRALQEEVNRRIREAGFRYVALDLAGYQMGSLNAGITPAPENTAPKK